MVQKATDNALEKRIQELERIANDLKRKYETAQVDADRFKMCESENIIRELLNVPIATILRLDLNGIILDCNETMAERFGKPIPTLLGMCVWDLIPPKTTEIRQHYFRKALQEDQTVRWEDQRNTFWFDNIFKPIKNIRGEITSVLEFGLDITERKNTEEALRQSERNFRSLAENSQDYIMRYDRQCRHLYINPAAVAISGYKEEDITGKTHREAGFDEELCQLWEEKILHVFHTQQSSQAIFEWQTQNGKSILDWRLYPEYGSDGQVATVLGIARDITGIKMAEAALRATEAKLARSQKMESIGLLAGGVAHDLNNILSGIMTYPELLLTGMDPTHELRKPLEAIKKSGENAVTIVQDLLTIAKGIATPKMPLNLNKIIQLSPRKFRLPA